MNRSRPSMHLLAAIFSAAVATFGSVESAVAGPATDIVKAKQSALTDLLKQRTPDAPKKMDAIYDSMLDYGAMSEASLGSEWAARSDAEKAQFSDLLKQLVRKSYEKTLKKLLAYNTTYVGEDAAGVDAINVKTKSQSKAVDAREESVEIVFKVFQKNGKWLVTDISTEGVSLVGSYRSQFTKIIIKDGFPKLLAKMKDKLAKGDF